MLTTSASPFPDGRSLKAVAEPDAGDEPSDLAGLIGQLAWARDQDRVMALVNRGVRRLLGADGVTFVLREGGLCHYAAEEAISPLWQGQRFPIDLCCAGWAMLHGTAAISDVFADPRIPADAYRLTFVRSLIMVPVGRKEAVAAVGAYWRSVRTFSQDEMAGMAAIADAAAAALDTLSRLRGLTAAAEQANRNTESAQRVLASLRGFMSVANHGLRQPFQTMRLLQGVLEQQASTPPVQATLARLDQAMARAEALLATLFDGAALAAAAVGPQPDAVALDGLLSWIVGDARPAAEAAGVDLRLRPSALVVWSDREQLARILRAVVGEAVAVAAPRSAPGAGAGRGGVLVGCRRRGDRVLVEVWNTGAGLTEAQQQAIAAAGRDDAAPRLAGLGSRGFDSGLGLVLAAGAARRLGHQVAVWSRAGCGTVYRLQLLRAG